MRDKGKLANWNDERGYGFIVPFSGAARVFVHVRAFSNRARRPEINDVVTYTLSKDEKGRPCAINATLAGARRPPRSKRRSSAWAILTAGLFLSAVGALIFIANLSTIVFVLYLTASIATFFAYRFDKSAARKGHWRTEEGTLHMLALIGGWPGALVAQSVLRHKTRKQAFLVIFWLTVILNCVALAWLLTPEGRAVIGR